MKKWFVYLKGDLGLLYVIDEVRDWLEVSYLGRLYIRG